MTDYATDYSTDYSTDHLRSRLALQAYEDKPQNVGDWHVVDQIHDAKTNFQAYAYENEKTHEVTIAYRGSTMSDHGHDWTHADVAIAGLKKWDPAFDKALEFTGKVIKDHPGQTVSVTGHSLGGSEAQLCAQMYGLSGTTFDPGAVERLTHEKEFKQFAGEHGLPEHGKGVPDSFNNYTVNGSIVSHGSNLISDFVGKTTPISGVADRTKDQQVHPHWYDPAIVKIVKEADDLAARHDMHRIERMFNDAERTHKLDQLGAITPAPSDNAPQYARNSRDNASALTVETASALPVDAGRKETTDHMLAALLSDDSAVMHAGINAGLNTSASQQNLQQAAQLAQA
ncbi:MAG TPA: Mbeg1-like protein, partial [Noviherbaspirillum sp.]